MIGAGQILATLVPISDELIIEAKLPPGDINYVSVGQKANVMLSAYDARSYGKLVGEVIKIGANTITDELDSSKYYPILIGVKDKTFDMAKDTTGKQSVNFGIYGIPESILINNETIVLKKFVGPLNEQNLNDIKEIINSL